MKLINNCFKAFKLIIAPWFFLIGKGFSSKYLTGLALKSDPQYLRALDGAGLSAGTSEYIYQFQTAAQLASIAPPDSAKIIKEMISLSESQLLQDIFCFLALNKKKSGFFVEVGVGSGRSISNTYMLEKHFGWRGILVEPNRSSHESIAKCRSAELERRAASSVSGKKVVFQEIIDAGEHSRIVGTGGHSIKGARTQQYEVETVTLTEVLEKYQAPTELDFLSLDTEGSEVDILNGLDLNRYKFKVLVIEHNFNRKKQLELDSILLPLGYRLVLKEVSRFDAWYIHKDVRSSILPLFLPETK